MRVEVVSAQRVEPRGARLALADDAGFPKHPEVMRAGRLRDGDVDASQASSPSPASLADHLQAHGIAQRVQHRPQLDRFATGVSRVSSVWVGTGCLS